MNSIMMEQLLSEESINNQPIKRRETMEVKPDESQNALLGNLK